MHRVSPQPAAVTHLMHKHDTDRQTLLSKPQYRSRSSFNIIILSFGCPWVPPAFMYFHTLYFRKKSFSSRQKNLSPYICVVLWDLLSIDDTLERLESLKCCVVISSILWSFCSDELPGTSSISRLRSSLNTSTSSSARSTSVSSRFTADL